MKLIQKIFLFCFLSILSASCLKKDTTFYDASQSPAVISFGNTGTPTYNLYPYYVADLGVVAQGDTSGFNINVIYGGPSSAPQDITVNLALDTAALRLYNNAQSTDFILGPADVFKFPSTVTIKAGTRMGAGRAVITVGGDYDYNAAYALPLKITSVSSNTTVSGNLSIAMYKYGVRNKYDGQYNVTGTYSDLVLGSAATAHYPKTINLITSGANSVGYYDINLNGGMYGYSFYNNGGGSYYGNFAPIFSFDANNNVTSVTNYYGQGTNSQKRSAELDPAGVNKITFNGSTPAKIQVSYIMVQAGNTRIKVTETFTYTGAR